MDDVVERNPKHCVGKCLVLERWKEHRAGFNRNVGFVIINDRGHDG
jgi:hypothetical protein